MMKGKNNPFTLSPGYFLFNNEELNNTSQPGERGR